MPKAKTIEIDEILPADGGEHPANPHSSDDRVQRGRTQAFSDQPMPDLAAGLGWKTRLTLKFTQWFLFLRSKSYGKWIIGPVVILAILLAIPLAMLAGLSLIILSILRSFNPSR